MLTLFDSGRHVAESPRTARLARLVSFTGLLVCCAPLFVLTLRGWANAVLFMGALLAALLLTSRELPAICLPARDRRWLVALLVAFVAPIISVAIAAAIRRDPYWPQFDAPSRFLLAIPIFLFVLRSGWPVWRVMQWVLPLALLAALAYLQTIGHDPKWLGDRVTTFVVDPLVFGYFSLAFGLMGLVSISPADWRRGGRWSVLLRVGTLALGVYLSVLSLSRTGWAAVPLILGTWAQFHWGRRHRLASAAVLAAVLLLPVATYFLVPAVSVRVDAAIKDVVEYPWHGVLRHETSLGYRITFLRMAADVIAAHPWAGIGDFAHEPPPPASAFSYASPDAVAYGFRSAFHNQVVSNTVRSGIGGLLATLMLLLVPLLICARGLWRGAPEARKDAMMGLAYCTCVAVSSISTEVVDLKFAASFYAVMTAVFCGAVLGRRGPQEDIA